MRFIGVDPSVTGFASVILDDQLNVVKEIGIYKKNNHLTIRPTTYDGFSRQIYKRI